MLDCDRQLSTFSNACLHGGLGSALLWRKENTASVWHVNMSWHARPVEVSVLGKGILYPHHATVHSNTTHMKPIPTASSTSLSNTN
jgi:hypothetical protein